MKRRSVIVLLLLLFLAVEPALHVHPMGDVKAPCPACNWGTAVAVIPDAPHVGPVTQSGMLDSPAVLLCALDTPASFASRAPPAA